MANRMNRTSNRNATPVTENPDVENKLAQLAQIADEAQATEIVSDRLKVKIDQRGDFIIGRLIEVAVFAPKKEGDKPQHVAYLDLPDGEQVRLNMSTDLIKKIKADQWGHFLGIQNTGKMDTGHKTGTPMTTFAVYDFDTRLPEKAARMELSFRVDEQDEQ